MRIIAAEVAITPQNQDEVEIECWDWANPGELRVHQGAVAPLPAPIVRSGALVHHFEMRVGHNGPVGAGSFRCGACQSTRSSYLWTTPGRRCLAQFRGDHEQHCRAYCCGFGVNGWPSASDTGTKMAVAGDEQGLVRGSSVSVGDWAQLPGAMSVFVCTATTVSLVVS